MVMRKDDFMDSSITSGLGLQSCFLIKHAKFLEIYLSVDALGCENQGFLSIPLILSI